MFFNYWDDLKVNEDQFICENLLNCFIYVFDQTFKNNGGFTATLELKSGINLQFLFDFGYSFIILVLLFQIIAGVIIDTFAKLREEEEKKRDDIKNVCFICGLNRQDFE